MNSERREEIDVVFDGPPAHESGRFIEVESPPGTSIAFGRWLQRDDGYWVLRFARSAIPPGHVVVKAEDLRGVLAMDDPPQTKKEYHASLDRLAAALKEEE